MSDYNLAPYTHPDIDPEWSVEPGETDGRYAFLPRYLLIGMVISLAWWAFDPAHPAEHPPTPVVDAEIRCMGADGQWGPCGGYSYGESSTRRFRETACESEIVGSAMVGIGVDGITEEVPYCRNACGGWARCEP